MACCGASGRRGVFSRHKFDNNAGTVKLHSTVYHHDLTVRIDQISYIDASRSGSGALGSAQQADLRRVGNDTQRGKQKL